MIVGLDKYAHEAGSCYRHAYGHHTRATPCGDPRCEPHQPTRYAEALKTAEVVRKVTGGPPKAFPFFDSHADAVCFQCDGPLSDHSNSGHAPMYGAFRGVCLKCGPLTRYDCAEGTVEMIQASERGQR